MREIPFLAWCAIGVIAVSLIALNIGLFTMLKNRGRIELRLPRSERSWKNMEKMGQVLRDPFKEQNDQMRTLSQLIHDLDKETPDKPNKD